MLVCAINALWHSVCAHSRIFRTFTTKKKVHWNTCCRWRCHLVTLSSWNYYYRPNDTFFEDKVTASLTISDLATLQKKLKEKTQPPFNATLKRRNLFNSHEIGTLLIMRGEKEIVVKEITLSIEQIQCSRINFSLSLFFACTMWSWSLATTSFINQRIVNDR